MNVGSGHQASGRIQAYRQAEHTRSQAERDDDVLRHLPLVHSVVERVAANLPSSVEREDLFHAGVIGLIDALDRFDPGRDNAFSTYAVLRIRGAIIDELRARDWVPRGARSRAKEYHQAVHELHHQLDRMPDDHELAAHLGVGVDDLPEIERGAQLNAQVSLEEPVGEDARLGNLLSHGGAEDNPARHMEDEDQRRVLLEILQTLKEQERRLLKLYYFEGLYMKDIASLLGVTESRVCQIHARLMTLLRTRLRSAGLSA